MDVAEHSDAAHLSHDADATTASVRRPPVQEVYRVREDRRDDLAGSEPCRLLAARQTEHQPLPHGAGGGAREHRSRADLLPREPPERLAEPLEPLVEDRFERLDGAVGAARCRYPPVKMIASASSAFIIVLSSSSTRSGSSGTMAWRTTTKAASSSASARPEPSVGFGARVADRDGDDPRSHGAAGKSPFHVSTAHFHGPSACLFQISTFLSVSALGLPLGSFALKVYAA